MPKKGYKQTPEHILKATESRGKLFGGNNPAYIPVNETTKKEIINLIDNGSAASQISAMFGLSKYIIKRITKHENKSIYDNLLVNNQKFISVSKLGSLNPMKRPENVLKRKQKINYKLVGIKISETMRRLFREGKLRQWNELHPSDWQKLLIKNQRRMKENNPMFNPKVVNKVVRSNKAKGIYEDSSRRMKFLWSQPNFRKRNTERLRINNPMKRQEVIIKNWKSHQHRPSGLEKKFMALINIHAFPIEYVGNAQFFIGHKNPDFKVIGQNKVIEVTSDAYGRSAVAYEKSMIAYYKERGYQCLVIWGNCRESSKDELKKENLSGILLKIRTFINGSGEVKVNV